MGFMAREGLDVFLSFLHWPNRTVPCITGTFKNAQPITFVDNRPFSIRQSPVLAITLLTLVRLVTRSASQSRNWQLIGMS